MINRRQFIINSGMAIGALAIAPSLAFNAKNNIIGLQLWTLKDSLPNNVKGVLQQISKAGFNDLETYGYSVDDGFFGTSLKDFKSIIDDNGLKASSNHFDFNATIEHNTTEYIKPYIEAANYLGSNYITIPHFNASLYGKSIDDYKKLASLFNEIGNLCQKGGLKLAYHNHDFEFNKLGSTNGYEVLLKETDVNLVDFELDLYWIVRSGNSPLEFFKKYPGRFKMWHVKDMYKSNPNLNTEIGAGTIDFKAIFNQARLSGMNRFFVEQESNYNPNPIESITNSLSFIKKELL